MVQYICKSLYRSLLCLLLLCLPLVPVDREGLGDSYRHLNDRVEVLARITVCLFSESFPVNCDFSSRGVFQ